MADSMTSKFSRMDSGAPNSDYQATVNINASPNDVFEAIITPSAISDWWVPTTGSGITGGKLVFRFGDMSANMNVDEAERPSRVRWSVLDCEPVPDWVGTNVTFDLSPADDGGTRLVFRHHGLTPQLECFDMCQDGWTEKLGNLLNYVEAGR